MDLKDWQGKYIAVYGTRIEVIFTVIAMINQYRKIDFVCVKDGDYEGLHMLNREVISFESLLRIQQDCLVIASPKDHAELCTQFENVFSYDDFGKEAQIDLGSKIAPVKGEYFYHIALDFHRVCKLIIWGTDETARVLYTKLQLIDVDIAYFIDDGGTNTDETICGKKVCSVYDLLYEDISTVMVIITSQDPQYSAKMLADLGLEECKNFRYIQQYEWNYYRWYHWIDPQLGYNIVNENCEKYPGFYVYGNDREDDYKIVILGGSTVDSTFYPFRSWPALLYEALSQCGYAVTIFSGGSWGYPVETEVVKLIRDVLPLKPQLVLDYSGVNNLVTDSDYPFCNVYQRQFYEHASKKNDDFPVTYGICSSKDNYAEWLSCERIMQSVCQEFGIRFYAIMQPLLGAKGTGYSDSEKEIILNTIANNPSVDYMARGKYFSDSVKEWIYQYYWLYDFSQIFDEYGDIWIDKCHVNERGNEIIAQKICEILCPVLQDQKKTG